MYPGIRHTGTSDIGEYDMYGVKFDAPRRAAISRGPITSRARSGPRSRVTVETQKQTSSHPFAISPREYTFQEAADARQRDSGYDGYRRQQQYGRSPLLVEQYDALRYPQPPAYQAYEAISDHEPDRRSNVSKTDFAGPDLLRRGRTSGRDRSGREGVIRSRRRASEELDSDHYLQRAKSKVHIQPRRDDEDDLTSEDEASLQNGFDIQPIAQPASKGSRVQRSESVAVAASAATIPFPSAEDLDHDAFLATSRFKGQMLVARILRSRWHGNDIDRVGLTGEIVLEESPALCSEKRHSGSASRHWYHLERQMMNFEEFIAAAESILQPSESTSRNVVRLLRDVQRDREHQRQHGREMDANCTCDSFYASNKQTASVKFLALPYHCLERYNGTYENALAPGSPLHSLRPMLQAHFISTTEKRELAQAVTRLPQTTPGDCLHVAQVWCLTVNDDTILTCSALSFSSLCADTITQSRELRKDASPQITVISGDSRSWHLPISERTTWPAFLSMFEDDLSISNGHYRDPYVSLWSPEGKVTAATWPKWRARAERVPVALRLKHRPLVRGYPAATIVSELPVPGRGPINDGSTRSPSNSNLTASVGADDHLGQMPRRDNLQLFLSASGNNSAMQMDADRLHQTLLLNQRRRERAAYSDCATAKVADIDAWLTANETNGRTRQSRYAKERRKCALAAKHLFAVFWPLEFTHPMTDKYWGALLSILNLKAEDFKPTSRSSSLEDISEARESSTSSHGSRDGNRRRSPRRGEPKANYPRPSTLLETADMVNTVVTLTQDFVNSPNDLLPIPEAFLQAWLHLLTGVILLAQDSPSSDQYGIPRSVIIKHMESTAECLRKGRHEVSLRFKARPLDERESCSSDSLVALFVGALAKDIVHGRVSIEDIYNSYFQALEFEIVDNPVPRSHQEKIRFFMQEVEAVMATLDSQASIVEVLQKLQKQQDADSDNSWLDQLSYPRQYEVLQRNAAFLAGRIATFNTLRSRAEELGKWHRNQMQLNKDRQEQAIVIFTIVTIIFLPLTFVSGVFGMNTKDVRTMSVNQWAYWATALPITLIVLVGSLWWAGLLDGIGSWLSARQGISRSRSRSRARQTDAREKVEALYIPERTRSDFDRPAPPFKGSFYPRRVPSYPV